jgi:hypothetical protein
MKQILLKEKFPVYTLDILKSETTLNNTDEVIDYLNSKIEAHPTASFIAIFDHYGHVKALEKGEIDENIIDSKNILFCMSDAIPNAMIAAVRPRAIAVNELRDKFVVNFMEAPMETPTNTMVEWVSSIKKA